jgi:DNA-directed RNA polymerase subunit RPC12/RpoP
MVKLAVKTKKNELEESVKTIAEKLSKLESTIVVEKSGKVEKSDDGDKLSQTLKDIKNKIPSTSIESGQEDKHGHEHSHESKLVDEIDCPSCKTGHVHKLKNDESGLFKCTGPECGKEYHLVSTTPDFQCIGCGTPIDKPPKELENTYTCPTCGKDHFQEFDKRKFKKIKT